VAGIPSQATMMAQAQAAGRGRGPAALGGGDPGTILFPAGPLTLQKIAPTITVTLADGQKIEGVDYGTSDFLVVMRDMQGGYHRWPREGDFPKVEAHNPRQAHFDLIRRLTDDDMHNVTAYLVTIK
jgi:cytochrome c oxidase cbb3-type subunit 3